MHHNLEISIYDPLKYKYLYKMNEEIHQLNEKGLKLALDVRKPVFPGLRTTKAQTDQRLCYSTTANNHI